MPSNAAIVPGWSSPARAMASPRATTSRSPSSNETAPLATSPVYSPRLWPAQAAGERPSRSTASRTTRLWTKVDSCALAVGVSSSIRASRRRRDRFRPAASLASPTTSHDGWSTQARPMPDRWDPCPGKVNTNTSARLDPGSRVMTRGGRPARPAGPSVARARPALFITRRSASPDDQATPDLPKSSGTGPDPRSGPSALSPISVPGHHATGRGTGRAHRGGPTGTIGGWVEEAAEVACEGTRQEDAVGVFRMFNGIVQNPDRSRLLHHRRRPVLATVAGCGAPVGTGPDPRLLQLVRVASPVGPGTSPDGARRAPARRRAGRGRIR